MIFYGGRSFFRVYHDMQVFRVADFIEIVNTTLKETLGADVFAVEGEVSGHRTSQGQWVTFDLKDEAAIINVFMPIWKLQLPIEDGMRVRVIGLPRVYPKYGKFSLSAERIEYAGEGNLKKALALLRQRLAAEGLFDPSRKRELPKFPQRIALVASRESAAYGDFLRIVGERWGGLEIDVYHVLVQGERAPQDIVSALQAANEREYDVLVMTRGGGSLEELMAFNDEPVVRAVRASRIPTLVAIGHERDITLAEEAADVRGSTPTDCARRLVPDKRDVEYALMATIATIEGTFVQRLQNGHALIQRTLAAPSFWLTTQRALLDRSVARTESVLRQWLRSLEDRWHASVRLLQSLDPMRVLARGYAIMRDADGRAIVSVSGLKMDQAVTVRLQDGEVGATIRQVHNQATQQKLL